MTELLVGTDTGLYVLDEDGGAGKSSRSTSIPTCTRSSTPEHRIKPPYPHGRPLYKSTDRGRTWTSISDDVPQSYGIPIAALGGSRPVLPAGVAFGVPPRWTARPDKAGAALIVSEDDGATWTAVSDGLPLPSPAMFDAIEVDARRRRFYAGTNEALYVSNDAQRGWTPVPLALPEIRVLVAG